MDGSQLAALFHFQPEFASRCPQSALNNVDGYDWVWLLRKHLQLGRYCHWDTLNMQNWVTLLCQHPVFADNCEDYWEILYVKDWASRGNHTSAQAKDLLLSLVLQQPSLASRCRNWRGWNEFTGDDWVKLLCQAPDNFADKCDWNNLNGDNWATLLSAKPQFADKCNWDNWEQVLINHPTFAEQCLQWPYWEWSRVKQLRLKNKDLAELFLRYWRGWEQLETGDDELGWLLKQNPIFVEKCKNHLNVLTPSNWVDLLCKLQLKELPEFANKCDWSIFTSEQLRQLFATQPAIIDHCHWDQLQGGVIARLLIERPEFADKFQDFWDKLNEQDWIDLLCIRPEFADKCNIWDELEWLHVRQLPLRNKKIEEQCLSKWQGWKDLSVTNWVELLKRNPMFAFKCNIWDKLTFSDIMQLPLRNENLAKQCHDNWQGWAKLEKGEDWVLLLKQNTIFADKCNWGKLNGNDWADLLCSRPEFADKCDWGKIKKVDDWEKLLSERRDFEKHCKDKSVLVELVRRQEKRTKLGAFFSVGPSYDTWRDIGR